MAIPNTIVLIARGRHEEFPADDGNTLPGHLLQKQSDGGVVRHATAGAGPVEILVAKEDVFQGGTINGVYNVQSQTYANYTSGSQVMVHVAAKGDKLLMRLASGQNVAAQTQLMSNGDGTLTAFFGPTLYQIVAPSTVVTNVNTETQFSNGTYTIPANFLAVGDIIRIAGKVFVIAENSTNTHQVKVYIGTGPTTLLDTTALQLAANDVVEFSLDLTIRTLGSSGTFVASGTLKYTISGTSTIKAVTIASTTIDTTVAETIAVKVTPSVANAGNQVRLDELTVIDSRAGGFAPVVQADEAINNSGGTTPFIRVLVL